MKRLLLFLALTGLFSCKEKSNLVVFTNTQPATDTTYIATIERTQDRNVLVEEFTGGNCSNCPKGANIINSMSKQYGDRVVTTGIHILGLGLGEPAHGAKFDFRTQDGTDISKTIFGSIYTLPSAGVDRTLYNGKLYFEWPDWAGIISGRLQVAPDVNLYVERQLDEASRELKVKIKVVYTKEIAFKHSLTVAIVENDIKDVQLNGLVIDTAYNFKHILRDIISPVTGYPVLEDIATKEAGRVYERSFTYTINDEWNIDNCELVVFVNRNDGVSKDVLQAIQVLFK